MEEKPDLATTQVKETKQKKTSGKAKQTSRTKRASAVGSLHVFVHSPMGPERLLYAVGAKQMNCLNVFAEGISASVLV